MGMSNETSATASQAEAHEGRCPEGAWHFRNDDDGEIYAAHPDGTTHVLGA
jgi:hypothetical protein